MSAPVLPPQPIDTAARQIARTPWRVSNFEQSAGGAGRVILGDDGFSIAHVMDRTPAENEAAAALIVEAVNNHASMLKTLEHCAKHYDLLALTMDRWAADSVAGGRPTHQVTENRQRANDCRRYAANIRSALPEPKP